MAPTRTGKGVGTIIPNLLTADRSMICIDPKGENARIAGRARQKFGPVHILDPFGVTGLPSAAFNPLDQLDPAGLDVAEDASTLADALVFDEPGMAGEAHWNEEAKALIGGLILHIVAQEPRERRNLATLRESLTRPGNLRRTPEGNAGVTRSGRPGRPRRKSSSRKIRPGSRRRPVGHTAPYPFPRFAPHDSRTRPLRFPLCRSQAPQRLRFPRPAARSPFDLFTLAAPARRAKPHRHGPRSRQARRSGSLSAGRVRRPRAPGPIERAMGLMAGYGVQLWPILQDVHQLRATYGQRAGTFLSNAGVLQVFGVNDHDSARLVSDLLGQETVVFQTMSRALDSDKSGISYGEQHTARPLLTPDEVRNLPQNLELLFLAGQRPIVAGKLAYYADAEFKGLFDQA